MNNNAPQGYQVINLIDLLWYICCRWRVLISAMLLCAVLVGGYRVYKNNAFNAGLQQTQQAQENAGAGPSAYEQLTQAETVPVDNAVSYAMQLQLLLNYQESSVYLSLDPYHVNVQLLNYVIEVKGSDTAENGMDAGTLAGLIRQAYVSYINSGAAAGKLAETYTDMDQVSISELISAEELSQTSASSVSQQGSFTTNGDTTTFEVEPGSGADKAYALFRVRALGRTGEDAKTLADTLDQILKDYTAALTGTLDQHTVTLSDSNAGVVVDMNLAAARQNLQTNLINTRTGMNNLVAAFSDNQKAAYESILESSGIAESEATDETAGTDGAEGTIASGAQPISLTNGLAKFVLLGLFMGLMLAAVFLALIYVLVPTLKTTEDFTRCFQYYLMADLSCYQDAPKRFGAGVDCFLNKLRYRDRLPLEEEERLLATNLKVTCQKEGLTSVYLTSSHTLSEKELGIVQGLTEALKKENITVSYGRSIERDAESYENMTNTGAVVYVEKLGKCRFDSLENISAMTQKQGVKILGVVAM